jgi:peptide/nickel transport system substrate-binding protein
MDASGESKVTNIFRAAAVVLIVAALQASPAAAQKAGGVLRVYHQDSPASMSIHEEATYSTVVPMMGVFNNLVMYRQDIAQNSLDTIVPDLAIQWSWSEDGTELTFKLHGDVKWHDGQPFTAADVKCTFDLLLGQSSDKLRLNPHKTWYKNLETVTAPDDETAVFHLRRPQPALLALLASGDTPIYPCHVSARQMRIHPIGTGPFEFVGFKPNESITVARNPNYWRKGRPYLDGIEYPIIPDRATAILAFIAGKVDMTWPYALTIPLLKEIEEQAPHAVCALRTTNGSTNLLVNRDTPPFDNTDLRRAMTFSIDRKSFVEILSEGKGKIGGAMLPPPEGLWGLPPELLEQLPGYGPDVTKNRDEARRIMQGLGYAPEKRLAIKVATRNIANYRDPAVILIDQLKEIYIDAELDPVETANWLPKVARKDYMVGLNLTGSAVDDPDQQFYENYACGSERNYTDYCNPELEKVFELQSRETDREKRKHLVWEIDRKLQEDQARPILYHARYATCWQSYVRGLTIMSNSIYNGWRFEDVWLNR